MKLLKQFLIILAISFVGEILKYLLPLPVPASIYGMVILFIGLLTGLIPLNSVRSAGKFMIEIMPVMFIPAGVGLMSSCSNHYSKKCHNRDYKHRYEHRLKIAPG